MPMSRRGGTTFLAAETRTQWCLMHLVDRNMTLSWQRRLSVVTASSSSNNSQDDYFRNDQQTSSESGEKRDATTSQSINNQCDPKAVGSKPLPNYHLSLSANRIKATNEADFFEGGSNLNVKEAV